MTDRRKRPTEELRRSQVNARLNALRRSKGKLDFNDYWKVFHCVYSDEFADSPAKPTEADEATWQLIEVLVAHHGPGRSGGGGIARRRDKEMRECL